MTGAEILHSLNFTFSVMGVAVRPPQQPVGRGAAATACKLAGRRVASGLNGG